MMHFTQILMFGVIAAIAAVIALIIFLVAYKTKEPTPLPFVRPTFACLPKYITPIALPQDIIAAGSPELALGERLAEYGFSESSQTVGKVCYTRGSIVGDLSVKIAKINLTFSLPLYRRPTMTVVAGGPLAFDTGDLWKLTTELKEKLER